MAKFTEEVQESLKRLEVGQAVHSERLDTYNKYLLDHMARTAQLEGRVQPLEDHTRFVRTLFKFFAASVPVLAGLVSILHYVFKAF